jgi:hypothetical protein
MSKDCTIKHDAQCEADARARVKLTLWGAELKDGCGCVERAEVMTTPLSDGERLRVDLLALTALMDERPEGEEPHVQQAWTAAADAVRATLGPPPKDDRRFEHCGFPESHEPHATTYTYCDGSADDVANLMERQLQVLRERDAALK